MTNSEKSILTLNEWNGLQRMLNEHVFLFCSNRGGEYVLLHLISRTISYHKFTEQFRIGHLLKGRGNFCRLPLSCSRTTLWKGYKDLEKRGIATFEQRGKKEAMVARLNVPALIRFLTASFGGLYENDPSAGVALALLDRLYLKLEEHWDNQNWAIGRITSKEAKMAGLEENIKKGEHRSKEALDRMKKKREGKEAKFVKAGWILTWLDEACNQYDIACRATLCSEAERQKVKGCAKNFVSYCVRDGLNPKDVIWEVVEHWEDFRTSLRRDDGTRIILPSVVDFMSFFNSRVEIIEWLQAPREERPDSWNVKIVNINTK